MNDGTIITILFKITLCPSSANHNSSRTGLGLCIFSILFVIRAIGLHGTGWQPIRSQLYVIHNGVIDYEKEAGLNAQDLSEVLGWLEKQSDRDSDTFCTAEEMRRELRCPEEINPERTTSYVLLPNSSVSDDASLFVAEISANHDSPDGQPIRFCMTRGRHIPTLTDNAFIQLLLYDKIQKKINVIPDP